MPKLTEKHFRWLAEDIAPLIQAGRGEHFANLVKEFSENNKFDYDKFLHVSWSNWNALNPEYPDQTELDDSIPDKETPHVINSKAA